VGSDLLVVLAQNGDISAWHTSDGSPAWHITVNALSTPKVSSLPALSTLLITNQTISILKKISPAQTPEQSLLMALQTRNGQILWQDPPRLNLGYATLAQSGNALYLHTDSTLSKLDARSGTLLWQRDLGGDLGGLVAPVVANNVVYVVENNSLSALRTTDGSQIWSYTFYESGSSALQMISPDVLLVTAAPVHYAGLWNFCPGDAEPYYALFAFNAHNGSIYWRYKLTL
jgi:outer membrane protein assembly factor BamB